MGKFDGMDPELVRELLAEVKQAAEQMRTVEGRVTRLMSGAGLSSQSAHRPVQVAEACDALVKDVSGRVVLLEKKADQKETSGGPRVEDQSADDPPKPEPKDSAPEPKPEPKDSAPEPKPEPKDSAPESKPEPKDSAPEPKPEPKDSAPESKPEPKDSAPEPKPEPKDSGPEPKPEPKDPPPDGSRDDDLMDTPRKDHPDDIDQSGDPKPQVVMVDGVRVLQIPLDPPTAAEVETLLRNIEGVPPMDMPSVEGDPEAVDGPPGQVEPGEPLPTAKPDSPVVETAGPADDEAIQPPRAEGEVRPGDTTPGDTTPGDTTPGDSGAQEDSGTQGESGGSGGSGSGDDSGGSTAPWATDGGDVVSVEARPLDPDALRTLVDNVREIEPLDMPDVRVPDGETWGEGPWAPMDIRPDGPAGDVEPGEPLRPIPPPGGSSGAESA
ncbi:hypothetical protein [Planobispora rosea]|uniref:hypothetical protein n=2 Tax=Planobispora rosea TaxID=35762 RepID=UPI001E42DC7D|nr:hypothetical protein [Planobispora rosea]